MIGLGWSFAAAIAAGVALAGVVRLIVPPTPRLGPRVRPYVLPERTALGLPADPAVGVGSDGPARRALDVLVEATAGRVASALDEGAEARLRRRLRQARLLTDVPEERKTQEYRLRQVGGATVGGVGGAALALTLGFSAGAAILLAVTGCVLGGTRWPSRLNRTIEERCARIRIELYTINQLLAMNVRVGGGPVQAVQRVVERGRGEVVDELTDALKAHMSGLRAAEAFERIAAETPEAAAARTYRLLASASELGTDLAGALRALSDDVREARRDALKRQATRRRAAMLVPIIAVLAPTMLLFIAAPIPSLVFGAR